MIFSRAASQPSFKSISEFLASLDHSDCQSYASDDTSLRDTETDEVMIPHPVTIQRSDNTASGQETEDTEKSRDEGGFNISVESVSEEYGHCSQLLEEVRSHPSISRLLIGHH